MWLTLRVGIVAVFAITLGGLPSLALVVTVVSESPAIDSLVIALAPMIAAAARAVLAPRHGLTEVR